MEEKKFGEQTSSENVNTETPSQPSANNPANEEVVNTQNNSNENADAPKNLDMSIFKNVDTPKNNNNADAKPAKKNDAFVQSSSEFKRAEDDYFAQIEEINKQKKEQEEKIKISQVQQEELLKEEEIAKREAKLRMQKQELEEREAEVKKIEDERRQKQEQEERNKRNLENAERKKREEQEERVRRLEQEEALQRAKLAELEAAEARNKEIVSGVNATTDLDKAKVEQTKKQIQNEKNDGKPKKKLSGLAKALIAISVVLVLVVVGVIVLKVVLSSTPSNNIVSASLTLEQSEFFEGDELVDLFDISKNYITATYEDGSTKKFALESGMLKSDFIVQKEIDLEDVGEVDLKETRIYIKILDGLTDAEVKNFTVQFAGMNVVKQITIKGMEQLNASSAEFFMGKGLYQEFDYLFHNDIGFTVMLSNGQSKLLTPLQYKLFIKIGTTFVALEEQNGHFVLPSLINLGMSANQNFQLKGELAGVGASFVQPELFEQAQMSETTISKVSFATDNTNATLNVYSLDVLETVLTEMVEVNEEQVERKYCEADVKEYLFNVLQGGIYVNFSNKTNSAVKANFGYHDTDDDTDYVIRIEKNAQGQLVVSRTEFSANTDSRLCVWCNQFKLDFDNNKVLYEYSLLGTLLTRKDAGYFYNLTDASKNVKFDVYINKDTVVSCEFPSVTYTGTVKFGEEISDSFLDNLVVVYHLKSGKTLEYNNATNKIQKVNGATKVVELGEDESFKLKIQPLKNDTVNPKYFYNGNNVESGKAVYKFSENGDGTTVTIYVYCDMFKEVDIYMASVQTSQILNAPNAN